MPHARWKTPHWIALLLAAFAIALVFMWFRNPISVDPETADAVAVVDAEGRIRLSAEQVQALGIETQLAQAATSLPITGLPAEAMPPLSSSGLVALPFGGVVTRVMVDEGEQVEKGQPLLRLQSPELVRLQGELSRAGSTARLAEQQAQRDALLADEGIISSARKAESAAQAATARSALAEARGLLSQLAPAEDGLPGEYALLAPMSGRVLRRSVAPGAAIEAMSPAFVIAEGTELDIYFSAPIALHAQLQPGRVVSLPGGGQGRVLAVGADTDAATQTLRVRARAEGEHGLLAGQQFELVLELPAPADAVEVPVSALQPQGQREILFVQEGQAFRALVVERLGGDGTTAIVRGSGLQAGAQVVSKGSTVLKSLAPAAG